MYKLEIVENVCDVNDDLSQWGAIRMSELL